MFTITIERQYYLIHNFFTTFVSLVYLDDDFSTIATPFMALHVLIVAIVGMAANLCVFLALSMGHKVSNNLLLLNLCVADCMVCIISGPLTVLSWKWPVLSSYSIVNALQVIFLKLLLFNYLLGEWQSILQYKDFRVIFYNTYSLFRKIQTFLEYFFSNNLKKCYPKCYALSLFL